MPKSRSRTRARVIRAGLTTGVVVGALLVAPQAAWAAVTVTPTVVAASGAVTIVDSGVTFPDPPVVEVQTAACGTRYTTPTTGIIAVSSASITRTNATQIVVTLPSTVTAGTNGAAKRWNVCVYDTTSTTSSTKTGSYSINVGSTTVANPTYGPSGGGNTVTITAPTDSPFLSGITSVGAQFSSSPCPATYGTPTANLATTVTRTSDYVASLTVPSCVVTTTAAPTVYDLCLYNGASSGSALLTVVSYEADAVTPSQPSGPYAGQNALTFTATTPIFAGITTLGVAFSSSSSCPSVYESTGTTSPTNTNLLVAAADIRKLTDTMIAVKAPNMANTAGVSSAPLYPYSMRACIYNGVTDNSSPLLASTLYAATTVQAATSVTPSSGPALGGNKVTVSGTNFPTTAGSITATLGGAPMTNITPISSTAFTANAPAHDPANNVVLVVTTSSGQSVKTNAYTYTSSLSVAPNTAPNNAPIDVLVKGVGFQSMTWTDVPSLTNSHIYLVEGTYDETDVGSNVRSNPPIAECENVLAFSDTQLVCTLALERMLDAEGDQYYVPVQRAAGLTITASAAGSRLITVSGGTFSRQDIGMVLGAHTAFTSNATIVDVLSSTTAIVDTAAGSGTAADAAITLTVPGTTVTALSIVVANNATSITQTASALFNATDVGKFISGASDIPAGTYIASLSPDRTIAYLAGGAVDSSVVSPNTSVSLIPPLPVPEGTYNLTYVSNGVDDAAESDPDYVESVVSSGSSFTVSQF